MSAPRPERYGLLAGFGSPEALLHAAERTRDRGYRAIDAFTPFPVEGLPALIGVKKSGILRWAFIGGAIGGLGIIGLQLYSTTINYPIDVGGRPLAAMTAFLVPAFECTVLGAALTAFFGMLAGNRLPTYYHPVFNAQSFSLADGETFYLLLDSASPDFDRTKARRLLKSLDAVTIEDVQP
jgi:hypothetical protein